MSNAVIGDGNGTTVAVKGAGVAAIASDPAIVAALSPNSPLPPGLATEITANPTVQAISYNVGRVIAGVIPLVGLLSSNFTGVLESLALKFAGSLQTGGFYICLFKAAPTGTFTDNALPAIAGADSASLIGIYYAITPISQLGTHTIYNLDAIGKAIKGLSANLYAVIIPDSATATMASTADMILTATVIF